MSSEQKFSGNILALDTATESCSVALWQDGEVTEHFEIAPRRHGDLVLDMVANLLGEADLTMQDLHYLACGRGPGAFTGVRLGLSIAQGLALGADLQVIPISTLQALAFEARQHGNQNNGPTVLAALDARMGDIYVGGFTLADEKIDVLTAEQVITPDALNLETRYAIGVGTGFTTYNDLLAPKVDHILPDTWPRARHIATLASHQTESAVPPEHLEPTYLRNKVTG